MKNLQTYLIVLQTAEISILKSIKTYHIIAILPTIQPLYSCSIKVLTSSKLLQRLFFEKSMLETGPESTIICTIMTNLTHMNYNDNFK